MRVKMLYVPGPWSTWWQGEYPKLRLPYGMGIITSVLRNNGFAVEQEDLGVKSSAKNASKMNPVILSENKYARQCLSVGTGNRKLSMLADEMLDGVVYDGFDVIGFSVLSYPQFLLALLLAQKLKRLL